MPRKRYFCRRRNYLDPGNTSPIWFASTLITLEFPFRVFFSFVWLDHLDTVGLFPFLYIFFWFVSFLFYLTTLTWLNRIPFLFWHLFSVWLDHLDTVDLFPFLFWHLFSVCLDHQAVVHRFHLLFLFQNCVISVWLDHLDTVDLFPFLFFFFFCLPWPPRHGSAVLFSGFFRIVSFLFDLTTLPQLTCFFFNFVHLFDHMSEWVLVVFVIISQKGSVERATCRGNSFMDGQSRWLGRLIIIIMFTIIILIKINIMTILITRWLEVGVCVNWISDNFAWWCEVVNIIIIIDVIVVIFVVIFAIVVIVVIVIIVSILTSIVNIILWF